MSSEISRPWQAVFQPLGSLDGYKTWAVQLEAVLVSMDLWGAIEPEEGQMVSKGVDAKARARLLLCVEE
eukprot:scaffold323805_cov32-Tisochrysis_lutea.AAC.1